MKRKSWIFLHLLFLIFTVNGQIEIKSVLLNNGQCDFRISEEFFKKIQSNSSEFKFDILAQPIDSFKSSELQLGIHYWFVVDIKNNGAEPQSWFLQTPLHSEISEVYKLKNGNASPILLLDAGQLKPFTQKKVSVRTNAAELTLKPNETCRLLFHFYWDKSIDYSVIISDTTTYLEVNARGYLIVGILYGFLLLMILYNAILYWSVRDSIYLYYIGYVVSCFLLLLWKDGVGAEYIWPNWPSFNHHHHRVALYSMVLTSVFYTYRFLGVTLESKLNKWIFYGLIGGNTLFVVSTYFIPHYFDVLPVPYLVTYAVLFGITFTSYRNGIKYARFFLVSLVSIISAFIILKLRYWEVLSWNWFFEYILSYAVALDAVVISMAIREKISILRTEKIEADKVKQEEVRLKLENEYVQLRNQSLQNELQHQNQELAMMVSMEAQKNEFIQKIKESLEEIIQTNPQFSELKKILKQFDQDDYELKWEKFKLNFDKANNNILTRLEQEQPKLKQSDLLFCAYMLMNKTNKELASLLNISVSGVEKRQLRLKEKLGIQISLSEFLQQVRRSLEN